VTGVPMGRLGLSEEVANAIVFIASDEASFISARRRHSLAKGVSRWELQSVFSEGMMIAAAMTRGDGAADEAGAGGSAGSDGIADRSLAQESIEQPAPRSRVRAPVPTTLSRKAVIGPTWLPSHQPTWPPNTAPTRPKSRVRLETLATPRGMQS